MLIPALPFCRVALKAERPVLPFYPKSLKTLGDHFKKKRLDLKLLQKDVAKKIGVDHHSQLGKGPRIPETQFYTKDPKLSWI